MARLRFAYVLTFVCSNGAACELPALPIVPTSIGDDVASVLLDVRRYWDSLIESIDGETRDCLFGSSVAKTGVVNKGAVLFFLRGGTAYLNVLEATCPDLEREDGFFVGEQSATGVGVNPASRGAIGPTGERRGMETPLSSRICDQDRIFPYREGSTRVVLACDLGRFFAVSQDEALLLLAAFDSPSSAPGGAETSGAP